MVNPKNHESVIGVKARHEIKNLILNKLTKKLDKGLPKEQYKPFFQAIFNKKQILSASLIHGFYTSFGMSIYEQMTEILAKSKGLTYKRQYTLLGEINKETNTLILGIQQDLIVGKREPDAIKERALIKKVIAVSKNPIKQPYSIVDLFIRFPNGKEYYIGLTSVANNIESFQSHKLKLLRWISLRLSQDPNANVNAAIAIPTNPYYPERYVRFGSDHLFDKTQILVQENFWDLIGGEGTFDELKEIFTEVGKELREKIDKL